MMILLLACAEYKAPLSLDTLWVGTTAPNRGHLVAELQDSRGLTVTDWTEDELSLLIDGDEIAAEVRGWGDRDVLQKTIILLDLSDGASIGPLKAAARTVIEQVEGEIALVGYAGEVEVFRSLTLDKDSLRTSLDELDILGATTNTNQALIEVLDDWDEDMDPSTGGVRGAVLVISNGGDGPDTIGLSDVREAAEGRPIISIGIGTNLEGFASHGSFRARDDEALPDTVDEALAALAASREGLMWLSWCGGGDQADLTFRRGRLRGSLLETVGGTGLSETAAWGQVTDLPEPIEAHHSRVVGEHLYVGGGDWDGNIFYARQLDGGLLGHFREGPAVPVPGSETRFGSWNDQLVAINGDKAWLLPLDEDGAPTEWEEMPSPLYANTIREADGVLYSISRQHVYVWDGSAWAQSAEIPDDGLDGYVGATIADGRIAVVGAWRAEATAPWESRGWSVSKDSLDDWEMLPSFPHYMGYFSTTDGEGSEVLVFPGSDADALDVLRLDGESWVVAGSLAIARDYYSTAFGPDGLLYLHGGRVEGAKITTGYISRIQGGELSLTCP